MSSEDNKEKIPIPFTNQKHFFCPHVRRSKSVLDYILNSTLWIPELLDSEFFVSGTWILDYNCLRDSGSGFHKQKLPGFRNLHYLARGNFFRGRSVNSLHYFHTNIQKNLLALVT